MDQGTTVALKRLANDVGSRGVRHTIVMFTPNRKRRRLPGDGQSYNLVVHPFARTALHQCRLPVRYYEERVTWIQG